jgi:hypothetical protein
MTLTKITGLSSAAIAVLTDVLPAPQIQFTASTVTITGTTAQVLRKVSGARDVLHRDGDAGARSLYTVQCKLEAALGLTGTVDPATVNGEVTPITKNVQLVVR